MAGADPSFMLRPLRPAPGRATRRPAWAGGLEIRPPSLVICQNRSARKHSGPKMLRVCPTPFRTCDCRPRAARRAARATHGNMSRNEPNGKRSQKRSGVEARPKLSRTEPKLVEPSQAWSIRARPQPEWAPPVFEPSRPTVRPGPPAVPNDLDRPQLRSNTTRILSHPAQS